MKRNGRQSNNVVVMSKEDGEKTVKIQEQKDKAVNNPRTLSNEPINYNEDRSNADRAKGALGQVIGNKLGQHLQRRETVKDPKPDKLDTNPNRTDAGFFVHTIKGN